MTFTTSGSRASTLPVKLLPIFTPPLTPPPLRVLAPAPSSAASSTQASIPGIGELDGAGEPGIATRRR